MASVIWCVHHASGVELRHASDDQSVGVLVEYEYFDNFFGDGQYASSDAGDLVALLVAMDESAWDHGAGGRSGITTDIGQGLSSFTLSPSLDASVYATGVGADEYDARAKAYTAVGDANPEPGWWTIEIASTGEPLGTPVHIDVSAMIDGWIGANGDAGYARATWSVLTNHGVVISSTAFVVEGGEFLSDSNNIGFDLTVGDTFELSMLLDGHAYGDMGITGAESWGQIDDYEVTVTATIIPEPTTGLLCVVALAAFGRTRRALLGCVNS